ncbi:MAG: hypothetical protein M1814_006470 [Vezdaea aestivalis]|nr:MAG: hypothetical protein M1814_006470 [Vezdaea aestivalis]
MRSLVQATLAQHLLPLVIPEFPGITVGGAFAGTAGESSSYREGLFEMGVEGVEVVAGDGRVAWAKEGELEGLRGSFGTLGVVTALLLRLRPAGGWVECVYRPVGNLVGELRKGIDGEGWEFLDGVVFGKGKGVVCQGRCVDEKTFGPEVRRRRVSRGRDKWFYQILERVSQTGISVTELLPTEDYLFRWDRGGFWVARYAFPYFLCPFNRLTRWALDRYLRADVMYRALHFSGLVERYVVQDLGVPVATAEGFEEFLDREMGIYPLWLCPVKVEPIGAGIYKDKGDGGAEMMVNFGVWGLGPPGKESMLEVNRRLENEVARLGGFKCLYAQAFYTEAEFWNIHNKAAYQELRAKWGAEYMPSVWDKVKRIEGKEEKASRSGLARLKTKLVEVRPVRGLYGVACAVIGREYLLREPEEGQKSA